MPTGVIPSANQTSLLKQYLPELTEALLLIERFRYSQRKKEENDKDVHGDHILIFNNLLLCMTRSSLLLSEAHFFIVCTTDKRESLF